MTMLRTLVVSGILTALCQASLGCGGKQEAETPEPASDIAEPEGDDVGDATQSLTASGDAGTDETSGDSTQESSSADAEEGEADKTPRQIKYIVSADGLEVEVEGVRFMTKAEPFQKEGGWGVRVSIEGKVKDGKKHSVLMPKNGPLAFAGSVTRGGNSSRFGDKRDGEDTTTIGPQKPIKATREWPGTIDEEPLKAGDSLDLEVGLWGLGDDAETRRPVRGFFVVKMKAGQRKPHPVVVPPDSAQNK
jgi:hypothetical protein